MQAFVTIPIFEIPTQLCQISSNLYWNKSNRTFYKSALLPPLTLLSADDLIVRKNIVFTQYNPSFLAIKHLYEKKEVQLDRLPEYLWEELVLKFGQLLAGKIVYNEEKTMNFLQQKIDAVESIIREKEYEGNDFIKMKVESQKKVLSVSTVEIIKNDVPELLLEKLLMTKYECTKRKKPVVLDTYMEDVSEEKKDKKKKSAAKSKSAPIIPKNQSFLTGFMKKKQ